MALAPLSQLSGWEVADKSDDIRGRRITDETGRDYGCVRDLIVDTEAERVRSVFTDTGRELPVEPLEIGEGNVVLHHSGDPEGWASTTCGRISVRPVPAFGGPATPACNQVRGSELRGTAIQATDGPIGTLHDVYFDDEIWAIRYFVVDTGRWLAGRKVLILPRALLAWSPSETSLQLSLSKEQIQGSPTADSDPPVSRQRSIQFGSNYGWPMAPGVVMPHFADAFGAGAVFPPPRVPEAEPSADGRATDEKHNPHLRSMNEVVGYKIEARDGGSGRVVDFSLDLAAVRITSLLVSTMDRLAEFPVPVGVHEVEAIRWEDQRVRIGLSESALLERLRDH